MYYFIYGHKHLNDFSLKEKKNLNVKDIVCVVLTLLYKSGSYAGKEDSGKNQIWVNSIKAVLFLPEEHYFLLVFYFLFCGIISDNKHRKRTVKMKI